MTQVSSPDTVTDPADGDGRPRQTYDLDDRGFNEVPRKWRNFYRHWEGENDVLAPNEIQCPVCKVVIRSKRDIRAGDRLYCMPCMSRLLVVMGDDGQLTTQVCY